MPTHNRGLLQDLVKEAMAGATERMVRSEAARHEKTASAAPINTQDNQSIPTDYAEKLAEACAWAAGQIKQASDIGPGTGPNALAVSQSTSGESPPGPGGQGKGHAQPPMNPGMQASNTGPANQMQNTMDSPPGGSGQQQTALSGGGKTASAKLKVARALSKVAEEDPEAMEDSERLRNAVMRSAGTTAALGAGGGALAGGALGAMGGAGSALGERLMGSEASMLGRGAMGGAGGAALGGLGGAAAGLGKGLAYGGAGALAGYGADSADGAAARGALGGSAIGALRGMQGAGNLREAAMGALKGGVGLNTALGALGGHTAFNARHEEMPEEKAASASLANALIGLRKQAEDAINPAQISGGGAATPPQSSASGEPGGQPVAGGYGSQTSMISSNEAAINLKRNSAYSLRKAELGKYFNEPALTQATDTTLQQAFAHSGEAGHKLASDQTAQAAAQMLLQKIASEADKETRKDSPRREKNAFDGGEC